MSATISANHPVLVLAPVWRVAPEYKLKQDRGEHSYANHRAAPLQKLARAVMGWAGAFCGGGRRAGWHGEKKSLIHHKGRKRRGWQRRLKFG